MTHKILKKHNVEIKEMCPIIPETDTSGLSHYLNAVPANNQPVLDPELQKQFQSQNACYPLIRPTTECFPIGINNLQLPLAIHIQPYGQYDTHVANFGTNPILRCRNISIKKVPIAGLMSIFIASFLIREKCGSATYVKLRTLSPIFIMSNQMKMASDQINTKKMSYHKGASISKLGRYTNLIY